MRKFCRRLLIRVSYDVIRDVQYDFRDYVTSSRSFMGHFTKYLYICNFLW